MSYERELETLVRWVKERPGLTVNQMKQQLHALPWPINIAVYDGSRESYKGTRFDAPPIECLNWKLRYLELKGDLRQEKGKWWANE